MADNWSMDVLAHTRELIAHQVGYQLVTICELTAQVAALTEQLTTVTKERDALKAAVDQAQG